MNFAVDTLSKQSSESDSHKKMTETLINILNILNSDEQIKILHYTDRIDF